MNTVRKLGYLLSPGERRKACLLLGMIILMALLDMLGIASIMPFMGVLANPDIIQSNQILKSIYAQLGFTSEEIFLIFLGAMVFSALAISTSFRALTTFTLLRFTNLRNFSIGRRLVAGYLHQPYEWFLDHHSADLGKTVLSEVQLVINGSLIPLMQLMAHGAVAVALTGLLIAVDPVLAAISAAILCMAYALVYLGLRRYLERIGAERLEANRERFEVIQETFGGIKDVKVAGLEQAMLTRFERPAFRFSNRQALAQIAALIPRFILEIIALGGILVVAIKLRTGPGGLEKALPILSVYAFAGYRLMPALQQIYEQLSKMRFSASALDTLYRDYCNLPATAPDWAEPERHLPIGLRHSLQLEDIEYTYPNSGQPVLKGLCLDIPACSTVGLIGSTGAGKTTVVDIILGLLQPQKGRILVDSTPITPDNVHDWQRAIGYVPQHIHLSDDTVAANIAFGVPAERIDNRALENAARIANLHEFVTNELPGGYATMVGERGVRLSGGQRQRIGIARALYHDPDVLILDEATSALDNLTEQAVMEAVHNLAHRKTIIIIAHRLTTLQECDHIFLLDKGTLTHEGTYSELLKGSRHFRAMAIE